MRKVKVTKKFDDGSTEESWFELPTKRIKPKRNKKEVVDDDNNNQKQKEK